MASGGQRLLIQRGHDRPDGRRLGYDSLTLMLPPRLVAVITCGDDESVVARV